MTRRRPRLPWLLPAVVLVGACGGGGQDADPVPDGDVAQGRAAILEYGCASCHAVPGVQSVTSGVGPDLNDFEDRMYIAGQVPNRPEELIRWLRNPQAVEPGTAMPDMGVTEQDARDIAAYLYQP